MAKKARRELSGRTVLFCLVAFFAVVFGVNAVMVTAAVVTFGGVETASSYQAGLAFARETSAVRAQEDLGWQVEVTPSEGPHVTRLVLTARDRAGAPIMGVTANGRILHPTDRRHDRPLSWRSVGAGMFEADVDRTPGQWDLVVELLQDGAPLFRTRNRMVLR